MPEHAEPPPRPAPHLPSRYVIGEQLGRGGAGVVYRAHDTRLDRDVALKLVHGADGQALDRQLAEIRTMAAVTGHENVVSLYDAFLPGDGHPGAGGTEAVLVMELVDGPSLSDVTKDGPLPIGVVRQLAKNLAAALVHLHGHGVVHRDVKPANVLIASSGQAKLADFGISRLEGNSALTATGLIIGSAGYFSPEQVRGQRAEAPSDVYALGLVLLEALTGRREYTGPPTEAALARLTRDPVIPPSLPAPLRVVLASMLAQDPAERSSAAEALAALSTMDLRPDAVEDADAATAPLALRHLRRRRAGMFVVAAVAVVALAALMGMWQFGGADPSTRLPAAPTSEVAESVPPSPLAATSAAQTGAASDTTLPAPDLTADPVAETWSGDAPQDPAATDNGPVTTDQGKDKGKDNGKSNNGNGNGTNKGNNGNAEKGPKAKGEDK